MFSKIAILSGVLAVLAPAVVAQNSTYTVNDMDISTVTALNGTVLTSASYPGPLPVVGGPVNNSTQYTNASSAISAIDDYDDMNAPYNGTFNAAAWVQSSLVPASNATNATTSTFTPAGSTATPAARRFRRDAYPRLAPGIAPAGAKWHI